MRQSGQAARLAPAIPEWVALEREAAMQVDEGILDSVAFLGTPLENSGFYAEGTAFFMRIPLGGLAFHYIVSCRHVVKPTKSRRDQTPNDGPIWLRINKERGKGPPSLIKAIRKEWITHSDRNVDVCV